MNDTDTRQPTAADPAVAAAQEIMQEQFVRLKDLTEQEQADIIRKHTAQWLRERAEPAVAQSADLAYPHTDRLGARYYATALTHAADELESHQPQQKSQQSIG